MAPKKSRASKEPIVESPSTRSTRSQRLSKRKALPSSSSSKRHKGGASITVFSSSDSSSHSEDSPAEVIRPPHSSWFVSNAAFGFWKDGYENRTLCPVAQLDEHFFIVENLPAFLKYWESLSGWLKEPSFPYFPRLVRLFYCNLQSSVVNGTLTLSSRIKGKTFSFNSSTLADILGTRRNLVCEYPSHKDIISQAKLLYVSSSSSSKNLTHSALRFDAKLVHNLIVRFIMPRVHSKELVTDQLLELIFLILNGYDIDYPKHILYFMKHSSSSTRSVPLPYANLLTKIFQHFKVDCSGEAPYETNVDLFNVKTMNNVRMFKLKNGEWKSVGELEPEELQKVEKTYKIKKPTTTTLPYSDLVPTLVDRISALESELEDVKGGLSDIWASVNSSRESMEQHFSLLHNKINQCFYIGSLIHKSSTKVMPLTRDEAYECRSKAGAVLVNCYQEAIARPVPRNLREESATIRAQHQATHEMDEAAHYRAEAFVHIDKAMDRAQADFADDVAKREAEKRVKRKMKEKKLDY